MGDDKGGEVVYTQKKIIDLLEKMNKTNIIWVKYFDYQVTTWLNFLVFQGLKMSAW